MSVFDGVNSSKNVKEEQDRVRGQKQVPLDSDIYNLVIKHVFAKKAKSGAMGIHAVFTTPEGRDIKMTEYITSGDGKGNKTYYEKKNADSGNMDQFNLPGFTLVESLRLTMDK